MSKFSRFDALADILRIAASRYPALGKRMKEAQALERWEQAVGPAIAKHARAIRVQDGVLWVEVDHPIWKSELHYRKRQILDLLNSGASQGAAAPKVSAKSGKLAKPMGPSTPDSSTKTELISDILLVDPRSRSR